MVQPGFRWQVYGRPALLAQATVLPLCEKYRAKPAYLATYRTNTQEWVKASMKTASVTPPDCKLGKT